MKKKVKRLIERLMLWNNFSYLINVTQASFLSFAETSQNVKTYVYVTLSLTWAQAQNYCRQNYKDLTIIENSVENAYVVNAVPPSAEIWIGLYRSPWKWSDNSISLFRNWRTGKPDNYNINQYCVTEDDQHQWDDDNCETTYAFLCYKGDSPLQHQQYFIF